MKLKENFISHQIGDEYMLISIGDTPFQGVVKNNKTAAFIIEQLKTETSVEEIKEAMLEKYDANEDIILENIEKALQTLRQIGALEE